MGRRMAIRVHCSQCGRTLSFPDSEAGLPALCNTCGTRLTVPQPFLQPPISAQNSSDDPELPWRLSAWLIGLLAIGMLAGGIILATRHALGGDPQRDWERQNAADIEQIKHDAETLIVGAQPGRAYAKYLELSRLVGDRNILDPKLKTEVEEARAAQERLLAKSLSAMETSAATATTEPVIPAAPLTAMTAPTTDRAPPAEPPARTETPPLAQARRRAAPMSKSRRW